jgi:hypothetical protein
MTEEVKVENVDASSDEQIEVSPIEQRARDMGWRPKEEFLGEEDDFVDAKEFVQRKPLFEKIESQSKQIKNVQKALDALQTHYTSVRETEYKRALEALKDQRKEAISNADGDRYEAVDTQIKQVESQFAEIKKEERQNTQNDPTEFVSWKAKNDWYEKDETMRVFADAYGVRLAKDGLAPNEVLQAVSKKVRAEFSHKFVNPNKKDAPDVGVSGGPQRASSSERYELSDTERTIMNTLVRSGTMTKEQYIADLKKIKASRN